MSPDDARLEDTRAWLRKAALGLRGVGIDLGADPPLLEHALFHSQQAAEKSLKAVWAFHDAPFRKTHNLDELGKECVRYHPGLKPLVLEAASLSEYAWLYRYPGDTPEPTIAEAREAQDLAARLNLAVLRLLPMKARPDRALKPGEGPGIAEPGVAYAAEPRAKGRSKTTKRKRARVK